MASIFSVQNLQTFLRRKYLRPPSRGPPPGRWPRGPRSLRSGRSGRSAGRESPPEGVPSAAGAFVSSAILLLKILVLLKLPAYSVKDLQPRGAQGATGRLLRCGRCRLGTRFRSDRRCGGAGLLSRLAELLDLV